MKIFKGALKVIVGILLLLFVIALVIIGIRYFNGNKYKPKDYDPSKELKATDLTQYETSIEGVKVDRVEGDYLNGFHLKPKEKVYKGVVITFGGSEGSPNYWMAQTLAKEGYEVLSLFFFGMDNQQKELVEVPLEFFIEVLDYIDQNIEDKDIITIYGGSKGAELGLNLATRYPEIDNLILMAPTEYSYMGLSFKDYSNIRSSWTWQGESVPFIDVRKGDPKDGMQLFKSFLLNEEVAYRPGYESAAKGDPNREEARIKVENTKANIVLFAGEEDRMWQSEVAAKNIQEKRPEGTETYIYEGAGHLFFGDRYVYTGGITLDMGGSKEANEKAGKESNKIIMDKLSQWHKK